ncbi:hypothetical protein [Bacillus salipaludis]|uniref:Uncharacterized protein n=1 Tax=Bacillus salipaludis TaxID=2547811 RepID=A0ABW8RJ06_9BACI
MIVVTAVGTIVEVNKATALCDAEIASKITSDEIAALIFFAG